MVTQLTLPVFAHDADHIDELIGRLVAKWRDRTGALRHAEYAAQVTRRRFDEWDSRPLTRDEQMRVESYFQAVLRLRILGGSDRSARAARGRLIALSIEEDLIRSGWDAVRAAEEASRAAGLPLSA
jgi:aryl carrier-like protein